MHVRLGHALVIGLAAFAVVACVGRLGAPSVGPSQEATTPSPSPASEPLASGPPAISRTAPGECGFPDGTVLQFAGRSTTRVLGVQEVPGSDDPLSIVPADIYVTRDPLGQGANDGFLVRAIYTGEADGFVEVTTVPETWAPPTE